MKELLGHKTEFQAVVEAPKQTARLQSRVHISPKQTYKQSLVTEYHTTMLSKPVVLHCTVGKQSLKPDWQQIAATPPFPWSPQHPLTCPSTLLGPGDAPHSFLPSPHTPSQAQHQPAAVPSPSQVAQKAQPRSWEQQLCFPAVFRLRGHLEVHPVINLLCLPAGLLGENFSFAFTRLSA